MAWGRWVRFQRLLAHATPAPPQWQALTASLSSKLSIRRVPTILAMPGRLPPLVVPGWRGARILLPTDLLEQLSDSQRAALLLHELVHIKRGDHLVRMLELSVGIVYWWLPVVGSFGRQLRACEETCCDVAVVDHLPQARRDYAKLLLDVIDFASPLPRQALPQATAMSAANDVEQRLRGILDATRPARRTWPVAALTVGLACATLPCQLHYDLIGREAPAAVERGCEPAAKATKWSGDVECAPIDTMGCPS
jgi:beta-lactamase regulating signal transducer with metallopeptidase domain